MPELSQVAFFSDIVGHTLGKVAPGVFASLQSLEGDGYVSSCHACVSVDLLQPLQQFKHF